MELSEVLLTKSGGETERQVYFVQSTGALEKQGEGLPELALRFDLTVPLARYVAEHEHDLVFPFRRYQMQRVYRGERAQRGRFREFYQCDIDVIGKDALSVRHDAEIPAVIAAVFDALAIGDFTIQLNHRKLLRGYFEGLGIGDGERQNAVLRELDKLDKRGEDAVRATLAGEGFGLDEAGRAAADGVLARAFAGATTTHWPNSMRSAPARRCSSRGATSCATSCNACVRWACRRRATRSTCRSRAAWITTPASSTRPRSMRYPQIGSICSGGRYDDLASHYSKSKLPGVGISIGLTRLFFQLREAGLIATADSSVDVLVTLLDEPGLDHALALSQSLRAAGLQCRDPARAEETREAAAICRSRRHPLRGDPRRGRSGARRGRGQGPAPRRTVRGRRRRNSRRALHAAREQPRALPEHNR